MFLRPIRCIRWPFMADETIDVLWGHELNLLEVKLPIVKEGVYRVFAVDIGPLLAVALQEVVVLVDATEATHAQALLPFPDVDHSAGSKVVDVFGHPAAIVKVSEEIRGFVVASDEESEDGSSDLAVVEAMELAHLSILLGTGHRHEIGFIAHALAS